MIATLDYIRQKFEEYNTMMFEGKLQPIAFRLSRARTFIGAVQCRRKRNPDGTWHYYDFVFVISTLVDRPENVVQDTIVHEMIHYWILSNQMQDDSPHGTLFKTKMAEINRRFGLHIQVSHRKTEEDMAKDTERRQHLICIIKLRGDKLGITIASRTRLFMLWDQIPLIPQVQECQWYTSADPFFNRYPRASSLKIYSISPAEFEEHRGDFRPLVREGNVIRIGRR